jgi:hypothetical protein
VRVWRVGDVVHCARERARRVSGLLTAHAATRVCAGAGRAQQPTRAARSARWSPGARNLRAQHVPPQRSRWRV